MSTLTLKKIAVILLCLIVFRFTLPFLWMFYLLFLPPLLIFLLLRYVVFQKPGPVKEDVFEAPTDYTWIKEFRGYLSSRIAPLLSQGSAILRQTLISLAFALLTFVIIYACCIGFIKTYRTKQLMTEISADVSDYRSRTSALPESLDEMAGGNPLKRSLKKDFWGNTISYRKDADSQGFTLLSPGRDGLPGTPDDIVLKSR